MKIGLLGIGTVGRGVMEQLQSRKDMQIKRVLVRREIPELGDLATYRFEDILEDKQIDTVVEVMGGMEPAFSYVMRALQAGKNVVTANKLMVSNHMEELMAAAKENKVALRIDACVGGGIPYLFNLMHSARADNVKSVYGIVNGTTNLILDTMQTTDADFGEVLKQAQDAGYAEADPTADVDGIDACCKLSIAASLGFKVILSPDEISVEGIRHITHEDAVNFKKLGLTCRLIARAERNADGSISAYVEPTLMDASYPEVTVRRNDNLISMVLDHAGRQSFMGQGAGKDPTAFAVVLGLMDIKGKLKSKGEMIAEGNANMDNAQAVHRYYVRTSLRMSVPAEKVRGSGSENVYLTLPMPVDRMHALAASMRLRDPELFFAGIRE